MSRNYEIALQEIPLIKGFSTIQKVGLSFLKTIFLVLLNFLLQNCSIFNNYCTISLKNTKPPWCTSIHGVLSNNTKSTMEGVVVWEIAM
jgi:hypothetical protein